MQIARIYTDEDIYGELAEALRKRGVDAESTAEAGNLGLEDREQLAYAVTQKRASLTFNRDHYERLAVEYFLNDREHYGIIISPQYEFGEFLRRVLKLLESVTADELRNQIRYLQAFK